MFNFALVIELARHIEILLLSNNCVIVPDLGGFMAHHIDAQYDESEELFLPPLRALGFNPQIKLNDSLLAQSYVEAYDLSYPEALRRIDNEVKELKHELSNIGTYELQNIGTLYWNDGGEISFEPCEAGILSPSLYGLGSFTAPILNADSFLFGKKEKVNIGTDDKNTEDISLNSFIDENEEEYKSQTVQIKVAWIRNAIAVAAAVVAFFVFSTPIANTEMNRQTASLSFQTAPDTTKMMVPSSEVESSLEVKAENPNKTEVTTQHTKLASTTENGEKTDTISSSYYTIVLASQVKESNAKIFIENLRNEGINDVSLYINNKVVRVVFGRFVSEAEAYNKLHYMRKKPNFDEAWVYHVKNQHSSH